MRRKVSSGEALTQAVGKTNTKTAKIVTDTLDNSDKSSTPEKGLEDMGKKITSTFHEVTKPYHYVITDEVEARDVVKWVFEGEKISLTPWKSACLYSALKYLLRCTRKNGEQDIDKAYQVLGDYIDCRDSGGKND